MTLHIDRLMSHVFEELCRGLDTPKSLAAWLLYDSGEHAQLVQLCARPSDYLDSDHVRFRDDYLVTEYLSKSKFLATGIDTAAAGSAAFYDAERQCAAANVGLRHLFDSDWKVSNFYRQVILLASEKIERCLGSHVPWTRIIDRFRWGKGATYSLKGEDVRLDTKLCEEQISVTQEALPFLRAAMATDYAWLRARGLDPEGPVSLCDGEFLVVRGSRGLLVPKNAKTERFIAAEPSGNIFLQLGVGAEIRRCLHRMGINLDDQSINQGLAKRALVDGLATVDLRQASDTISRELVWLLLPQRWASFLDALRSPELYFEGKWFSLSKFSSMGNGFTFELETLIFWGLTEALRDCLHVRGRVSVYGDDIICPIELDKFLPVLLDLVGFSVNTKKTHFGGVFRESCGKHFFGGYDVTPIYQKDEPRGQEIHRLVNRLIYHAIDRGCRLGDTLLADRKLRFASRIPGRLHGRREHCRIPIQGEVEARSLDGGFAVSYNREIFRYQDGKFSCRVWVFRPKQYPAFEYAIYAARARKSEERSTVDDSILRAVPHSTVARTNYFLWAVRKLQLRISTELAPFTGTVTQRDEGSWRIGKRLYPEACTLRWV